MSQHASATGPGGTPMPGIISYIGRETGSSSKLAWGARGPLSFLKDTRQLLFDHSSILVCFFFIITAGPITKLCACKYCTEGTMRSMQALVMADRPHPIHPGTLGVCGRSFASTATLPPQPRRGAYPHVQRPRSSCVFLAVLIIHVGRSFRVIFRVRAPIWASVLLRAPVAQLRAAGRRAAERRVVRDRRGYDSFQ